MWQVIWIARICDIRGHWLVANLERETEVSSCLKLRLYPEGTMNPFRIFSTHIEI